MFSVDELRRTSLCTKLGPAPVSRTDKILVNIVGSTFTLTRTF